MLIGPLFYFGISGDCGLEKYVDEIRSQYDDG